MAVAVRKNPRGFASLEYAVILPIVLVFTFGAIDVTNYFRAYNAVQEGVQSGLRCLYPTDGGCVAVNAPQTVPLQELYLPPFKADFHNYDGLEKHLILPSFAFGPIQAAVLKEVHFDVRAAMYGTARSIREAEGTIKYIKGTIPSVSGDYQQASMTGGIAVSAHGTVSGAVSCTNQNPTGIGEIFFTVPRNPIRQDPDLGQVNDCIEFLNDGQLDWDTRQHHGSIGDARCSAPRIKSVARLFINLPGSGYTETSSGLKGSSALVSGHLDMVLEYKDSAGNWTSSEVETKIASGSWNLGGQEFTAQSNQNFIPRGFSYFEFLHGGGTGASDADLQFQRYAYVTIPWGVHARLRFALSGRNGAACSAGLKVGYALGTPQLAVEDVVMQGERLFCQEHFYNSQCSPPPSCTINPAASIYYSVLGDRVGPVLHPACGRTIGSDDFVSDGQCVLTPPSVEEMLSRRSTLVRKPQDYVAQAGSDCVLPRVESCGDNFGVADPAFPGDNGTLYITHSEEAARVCPGPAEALPASRRWVEDTTIVHEDPILMPDADCLTHAGSLLPPALIPADAAQYKKKLLPRAVFTGSRASYAFGGDPDELMKTDRFHCSAVSKGEIYFDEAHLHDRFGTDQEALSRSLFIGSHEQLGCSRDNLLRAEAIKLGMNNAAFFKVTTDVPAGGDYFIGREAIDACTAALPDLSLADEAMRTQLSGGPFDEGTYPAECFVRGVNSCFEVPAGVREIAGTEGTRIDTELVQSRATAAMNSLLPGFASRVEATGASALETFDINRDAFELKASIQMPMLLLARTPIAVEYTSERRWEGQLLR